MFERADRSAFTGVELFAALERVHARMNRDAHEVQELVAEIERQGLHHDAGFGTVKAMLVGQLNMSRGQAVEVERLAAQAAARRSIHGEPLPAAREHVAQAQSRGTISPAHATVIVKVLAQVPSAVHPHRVEQVEQALVELAEKADPAQVAKAAAHALAVLDPDGEQPREDAIDRQRSVTVRRNPDGTGDVRAHLTPEALAAFEAGLSPLAAPRPADGDGRDPRTAAQRRHDALHDLFLRVLRSGSLPASGGVTTTVVVTVSLDDLQRRSGLAVTSSGATMSVDRLVRTCADMQLLPVFLSDTGGVLAYGRTIRLATAAQRRALAARDRGCSFPGCSIPPEWCDSHHVLEWLGATGPTDVDNMCLLCGPHHRMFAAWGWTVVMRGGRPEWIPPASVDPNQVPRRNTAHHRQLEFRDRLEELARAPGG